MKLFLRLILVSVFAVFLAGNAMAVPFGDGGTALQGVLDGITQGGPSSVDVLTDGLNDNGDSYWSIGGSGGSVTTVVIELAGFAGTNTFGIFDRANSANTVQVFGGGATTGSQVTLSIWADGSVVIGGTDTGIDFAGNDFGYYLDSTARFADGGGFFYSDTDLNTDGLDHMAAYQGQGDLVQILPYSAGLWQAGEYVLAFEDLRYSWADRDYTDFVVMVESVTPNPIPEPATMFLLGLGLVGFAGVARKKTV